MWSIVLRSEMVMIADRTRNSLYQSCERPTTDARNTIASRDKQLGTLSSLRSKRVTCDRSAIEYV